MVNLRIVRSFWTRSSPVQHRLSPAPAISKQSVYIHSRSQTMNKNLCDNGRKLYCTWVRFRDNLSGSVTERTFATTNIHFAKNKDRGKDNNRPTKVQVNLSELSEIINVEKLTTQMDRAVNELKNNYSKNLTLRSSVGSIEQIPITWEGKEYKLQELAQIARKPKTLVINVSAFPQVIPNVLQALAKSGMNLNPQQDGTTLFVPIPKVTKEHRENLAKSAKTLFIGCRDDIKDIQLRCIKSLKSKTDISKDVIHNTQNQLQTLADKFVGEAEAIFRMKQKELLGDAD